MASRWIGRVACAAVAALALGAAPQEDDEAKLLPEGAGKEVTARLCINCHGAGNFRKARLSKDEWENQVGDMVDRGAKGTEAELAAVVEYLAKNFGADSKINVNTAPMVEIKAVLTLTAPQAQAVVEYRDANGKFKTWQDLQKVPGIDAKKIEDKKDRMVF